ncbi:RIP metalloprotease RseP, partial [candidate division WOR-3 bacterium]|nr:RIP metalloprotease RseP [candidate division WOR-3 bacterium]
MLELATSGFWSPIADFVIYLVLPFILLLAFCITIHEFGHFLVAKLFHIPVEKFSIGFGPPLFRKKIGETDFRIAYFPLGGYVKMAGEEEGKILKTEKESEKANTPDFYDAPVYSRILVMFAGPLFNIISAIIVLIIIFSIFGLSIDPYTKIQVDENSYADRAGFINGDSIISVNDIRINNWDKFTEVLSNNIDKEVNITVMRNGRKITKNLVINLDSLGLTNLVPPILGTIKRGGPAYKAGMRTGDKVLKINGAEV